MRYFIVEADDPSHYTGLVNGSHKWGLPGIATCPACKSNGVVFKPVPISRPKKRAASGK